MEVGALFGDLARTCTALVELAPTLETGRTLDLAWAVVTLVFPAFLELALGVDTVFRRGLAVAFLAGDVALLDLCGDGVDPLVALGPVLRGLGE